MDDDGFYMAEIDGVRGLVPSNFLADASDQYAPAPGGPGQLLNILMQNSIFDSGPSN